MATLADVLTQNTQIKLEAEGKHLVAAIDAVQPAYFSVKVSDGPDNRARFKPGGKLKGTFLREDSVCSFESKLLKEENTPRKLHLSWPKTVTLEKIRCYQRSGFTGVEGSVSLRYEQVSRGTEFTFPKEAVATWIGGDELTIVSVADIPRGTVLALEVSQPISPVPLRLFARVHKTKTHGSLFHLRLIYQAISEKNRDAILKYCLQKQAQLKRAGLLPTQGKG